VIKPPQDGRRYLVQVAFQQLKDSTQFWVAIIEKAYAKLHGSYQNISGGFEDQAMADLTGGIPNRIKNLLQDMEVKWNQLKSLYEGAHLLGAGSLSGSDKDSTDDGVVKGHAYSILEVREVDSNRLLKMRNPWGSFEWKGRWSDGAMEWTPRMRKMLNYAESDEGDDGIFWMSYEDFCHKFRVIYFCKMMSETCSQVELQGIWSRSTGTSVGCKTDVNFKNPQYHIKVSSNCKVTFLLSQEECLTSEGTFKPVEHQGLVLYKDIDVHSPKKRMKKFQNSSKKGESEYINSRDIILECQLKANTWYIAVPMLYYSNKEATFTLRAYGECDHLTFKKI
jgi:hypothetical protein